MSLTARLDGGVPLFIRYDSVVGSGLPSELQEYASHKAAEISRANSVPVFRP
jgi:hypothetical protein